MRSNLQKLQSRLEATCKRKHEKKSENHWTATTWLLFFEDSHCRAIFDSSGNKNNDRPDIQIWLPKSISVSPDLWLESKSPGTFHSKREVEKAHTEVFQKVTTCLRHNQQLPKQIVISDFESTYIWNIESFKRSIAKYDGKNLMSALGSPLKILKTLQKNHFISELKASFESWISLAKQNGNDNQPLDLDSLVSELLNVSSDFRSNFLSKCVRYIEANSKVKRLFKEWMASGGEITVEAVNQDIKKSNIGAEEAFAELCFHSVMVRCFVIKWFLDHGHLSPSDTATAWSIVNADSKKSAWHNLLAPEPKKDSERVLYNLLKGSDVYLWVLEPIDSSVWASMRNAFNHYSLVAEKSDILGEFYQSYLQKYSKKSQKMLGQFYTPHRLTRAMWKLAGEIMREKGVSLSDKSCLVIDPCVGTGTFLTQGLRLLLDGGWGDTKKTYKGAELNSVFSRFSGFELNPLSRGVSLVNTLTEVLAHSSDSCQTFNPKLRIFETNAYDIPDSQQQDLFLAKASTEDDKSFRAWKNEILEASKAKAKNQYRIVIGNPPWKNPSPACKNNRIQNLLKTDIMPWSWEYQGQKLSTIKGCTHGIREDYIFFFGLGMRLLEERGLLVFVTNESWLNAPTYTLFRKYLLDNFKVHTILRVGPYFDSVKERAAVVAFERMETAVAGRNQKIRYIDWSDLTNDCWSKDWVNQKLQQFIDGDTKKSEFQTITPVGEQLNLRVRANEEFDNELPGLLPIEEIFKFVEAGAQSGCGPLFLSTNEETLKKRIKLLFQNKISSLVDEIADEVRGGHEKAEDLVQRAVASIKEYDAKFDSTAIRTVWAHFKSGNDNIPPKKGYCYMDSRLWLRPRTPRNEPGEKDFWSLSPKITFRDIYDPDDKIITATVDTKGVVIDNHFFNGGVYVASVTDMDGNSILTDKGRTLRGHFKSDEQFLWYISAILNSPQAKMWSKSSPQERIKIPVDIKPALAQKCADIESKLPAIWKRTDSSTLGSAVSLLLNDLVKRTAAEVRAQAVKTLKETKRTSRKS